MRYNFGGLRFFVQHAVDGLLDAQVYAASLRGGVEDSGLDNLVDRLKATTLNGSPLGISSWDYLLRPSVVSCEGGQTVPRAVSFELTTHRADSINL